MIENAAIIVAVVQAAKSFAGDKVAGYVTIAVAIVVGALLALYQEADIVQGIFNGLVAVGAVTTASKIGGK